MTRRLRRILSNRDVIVATGTMLVALAALTDPWLAVAAILTAGTLVFRERPGLLHYVTRLHLEPGDRVLIGVKGNLKTPRMQELATEIRRLFPENPVILVGNGFHVSRHIPPAPPKCTCATLERAFCTVHGAGSDAVVRVRQDGAAMVAADRLLGGGYNSILICPQTVERWPTTTQAHADLVIADEMVLKDRHGPAPRPASQTEIEFAAAFGDGYNRAVLIQRCATHSGSCGIVSGDFGPCELPAGHPGPHRKGGGPRHMQHAAQYDHPGA